MSLHSTDCTDDEILSSEECETGSISSSNVDQSEQQQEGGISRILSSISVEPALFTYIVAGALTASLTTNLLLERVCRLTFGADEVTCSNISVNATLKSDVEKTTAQITLYCDLLYNLPSIFLGPLMGAYSDKHGRKLLLVLPLIGTFITAIAQMMFAYFPNVTPLWLVLCYAPRGAVGGFAVFIMGCYSYVSDMSKLKSRTGRIAFIDAAMAGGMPVGLLLSGFLYRNLGYWPVYAINAALILVALLYVYLRIRNDTPPSYSGDAPVSVHSASVQSVVHAGQESSASVCSTSVADADSADVPLLQDDDDASSSTQEGSFSGQKTCVSGGFLSGIYDTLATCCKPRPYYDRASLWLLILTISFLAVVFNSTNFTFLYTKQRFNWDYSSYINFSIIYLLVDISGSGMLLYILNFKLGVHDYWLGFFSSIVLLGSKIVLGLATTKFLLYTSVAMSVCGIVPLVTIRSQLSKSVSPAEVGKVFSLVSAAESTLPVISEPGFTALFKATLDSQPGTVFFVAAGGYALSFVTYSILLILRHKKKVAMAAQMPSSISSSQHVS